MSRILFVDDEPMVLKGLKRLLYPMRKKWTTAFAQSGEQALDILSETQFDVIVSDMRMPGMDGEQLLSAVRDRYPDMVRIILTGQTDESKLTKTFFSAHQFLSKPCGLDTIVETIEHAVNSGAVIHDRQLKRIVTKVKQLPALPKVYHQIVEELNRDDPSVRRTAKIIAADPAICAKMLNLANSPFFGFTSKIATPDQAVALLGINTIRTLVLGVHMFALFDPAHTPDFSLEELWKHCLRVSGISRLIAEEEQLEQDMIDASSTAALLHDVGKLVLTTFFSEEYNAVLEDVRQSDRTVLELEREYLGVSHAEIGGYLLGLWGMPQDVVIGVMRHHDIMVLDQDVRPAMVVHMADILDHSLVVIHPNYGRPRADRERINILNLNDRLASWEHIAQKYIEESNLQDGAQT